MVPDIRQENGFTIVEILMSVVILTIGLLALTALQVSSIRGNTSGGDRSVANSIMMAKLNELRSRLYYQQGASGLYYEDAAIMPMAQFEEESVNAQGLNKEEFEAACNCDADDSLINEKFPFTLKWQVRNGAIPQSSAGASKIINISVEWQSSQMVNTESSSVPTVEKVEITDFPLSIQYRN